MTTTLPAILLAAVLAGLCHAADASRPSETWPWVDLTHPIPPGTRIGVPQTVTTDAPSSSLMTLLGAPARFAPDRPAIADLRPDQLTGRTVVVGVVDAVRTHRDYAVTVDDFLRWERRHGRIREGSIVLIHTGFGFWWPDPERYLGQSGSSAGTPGQASHPGLHPEAARWLATDRRVKAVGMDTAGVDPGGSGSTEVAQILSEAHIPIFTNVANMDRLPPTGSYGVALPLRLEDAGEAPVHIIAQFRARPSRIRSSSPAGPVF